MATVNNNPTAFSVFTQYTQNSYSLSKSMRRLSLGQKTSADDAAGVSISENLRADVRGTAMARQNVENGISSLTTADSWMQNISDMLARMNELVIQAQDGTMSATDRANLQKEFSQIQAEIRDVVTDKARYNGVGLLNGSTNFRTQVGSEGGQTISVTIGNMGKVTSPLQLAFSSTVSTAKLSVYDSDALTKINNAISAVTTERSSIGALQNRLEFTRAGLLSYEDNLRSAENKIRDVDMAREAATMNKYQVLTQVSNAMLVQANGLSQGVLQLFG